MKKSRFLTSISPFLEMGAIVTMEGKYETVPKLLNGAISSDFK